MPRTPPPRPSPSAYITEHGYRHLENEMKTLWAKRADVTIALSAAAAEGDRSENAEYIYRKKELRGIDRRLHYLQKRLPVLTVVSGAPDDRTRVFFGATVELSNEYGDLLRYRIAGPDEFDLEPDNISMDSPLAKGLMSRRNGEQVVIDTPEGTKKFIIMKINYRNENGTSSSTVS